MRKDFLIYRTIFNKYIDALRIWNERINLVAPGTMEEAWERHFEDSLSLIPFLGEYGFRTGSGWIADVGSGAGFPGMVLAIAGADVRICVESDSRKCAFLNEVKRIYGLDRLKIANERVEDMQIPDSDKGPIYEGVPIITGRAFAPLDRFIKMCRGIIGSNTKMILLKGADAQIEIDKALQQYDFEFAIYPKKIGNIIIIESIRNRVIFPNS